MFYLGIDIAKVNHVASLISEDGSILVKAIKFTNSNEGLQKLIDSIKDYDQSQIYCAMEATGSYWLSLFSSLTDKGFNVSVFNPYQIKSFRGAYSNRKQKNDVIDSIIIANFLSFNGVNQTSLPTENQSGNKKSTDEKTSKRGSPYLRHAIYQAAFIASNNDPVMHDYYVKKRAEGKHHYVALAGVERKLLGIIFHVLKENRDYRPSKSS